MTVPSFHPTVLGTRKRDMAYLASTQQFLEFGKNECGKIAAKLATSGPNPVRTVDDHGKIRRMLARWSRGAGSVRFEEGERRR